MPDITTTQIFSDGEKGITSTKMNNIIANSVIQPDFVLNKPTSSTLDPTDQLLEVKGSGAYARITGSQLVSSVSSQVDATPQIYSVRLRSFNAIGNPTFEVDQVSCGNSITAQAKGIDRWTYFKTGTMGASAGQIDLAGSNVVVPGTNFSISQKCYRITLTTQQASLAAGDNLFLQQFIEGPMMRELILDVTSLSVIVRSTVAGLKFGIALRDGGTTPAKTLPKLCTIPNANTWTLISLANLPSFVAAGGGTFNQTPGNVGYLLDITLAAGSTITAAANDTWQTGNFIGALGQSNFAASPVNSTFDIAFVQHEPGAVCTTPMDCPFTQNYDACLRYFQKTYGYATGLGTVTSNGARSFISFAQTAAFGPVSFFKPMAKIPTVTFYNHATGAANSVQDQNGTAHASVVANNINDNSFLYIGYATATINSCGVYAHYTADTGW
jgi:hypothetical protein